MAKQIKRGSLTLSDMSRLQRFIDELPEGDEQYSTMTMMLNVVNLNSHLNEYVAAVALHAYVGKHREHILNSPSLAPIAENFDVNLLQIWDEMAGREAAMVLYHVGWVFRYMRKMMGRTPTLQGVVDHTFLRKAQKDLEQGFPNFELARNAAGHRAEAMGSIDKIREHGVRDGDKVHFQWGRVEGDDYVVTFGGKMLSVSLTEDAIERLRAIIKTAYLAFPTLNHLFPKI